MSQHQNRSNHSSQSQRADNTVNQSKKLVVNTCSWRKARENECSSESRLVLVLLLIGWQSCASRFFKPIVWCSYTKPITFWKPTENRSHKTYTCKLTDDMKDHCGLFQVPSLSFIDSILLGRKRKELWELHVSAFVSHKSKRKNLGQWARRRH